MIRTENRSVFEGCRRIDPNQHVVEATHWLGCMAAHRDFLDATDGGLNWRTMRDREYINRFAGFQLPGPSRCAGALGDSVNQTLKKLHGPSHDEHVSELFFRVAWRIWNPRGCRVAAAVYDATVVFCDRFVERCPLTHDQMVQAAAAGGGISAMSAVCGFVSRKGIGDNREPPAARPFRSGVIRWSGKGLALPGGQS